MIVEELRGSTPLLTGEGPHWVEKDQSLVYVDIPGSYFFRYYPDTGRLQKLTPDNPELGKWATLIIPLEGSCEEFVVSIGNTLCFLKWSSHDSDHVIRRVVPFRKVEDGHNTRWNDGKCDPQGRLWAGTMAYETSPAVLPLHKGSLYSVDKTLQAKKHFDKISISNGMAWSNDRKKFFFIDSLNYSVEVFDYEDASGTISNKKVAYDFKKDGKNSIPDGMCIDVNGHLWVACYEGSEVICVDPTVGKVRHSVQLPSTKITSCCFGGKDYSSLFVTSACIGLSREAFDKYSGTGKTFRVSDLDTKGLPATGFSVTRDTVVSLLNE